MRRPAVWAAVIASALILPQTAHGSFPGRNGLIAVGGYGFNFKCRFVPVIHVMHPDGSGLRPLGQSAKCRVQRWAPEWAADGQHLMFMDFKSLGIAAADGSGARHVPTPEEGCGCSEHLASISPDGQRAVLAVSDEDGETERLWVVALDGSGALAIASGSEPRWSPDGSSIAYVTPGGQLGLIDVSSERTVLVRRFSRDVASLDWSPDGRRLLMVMWAKSETANFWLATVAATDPASRPRRVPLPRQFRARLDPVQAVWSPDGRRIAFIAYRHLDFETVRASLWVMRARGGHVRPLVRRGGLTDGTLPDSLSWQPVVD